MPAADHATYLGSVCDSLAVKYPDNEIINVVCHGHSVPAGYFATPYVKTFSSYPHLLHRMIKERFPFAVANVIVTGIGGEGPVDGAARFVRDALSHSPRVVTINYGHRTGGPGGEADSGAWRRMIERALEDGVKVILVTPIYTNAYYLQDETWDAIVRAAAAIRELADGYGVGLADAFAAFGRHMAAGGNLANLLSHVNHPTELGHELIALELGKYFIAR